MTSIQEPSPQNPEGSTSAVVPPWYTAGCQTRQFGVGAATTFGAAPSVVNSLANPPAAMVAAAKLLYPNLVSDA